MLRSSGGKGAVRTKDSGDLTGARFRAGIVSATRFGAFHSRAIDAGTGLGFLLFVFESSTPCLAFENSSRIEYARPPSSRMGARKTVSFPDLTQASISGLFGSLTYSRTACSVLTVNAYSP